MESLADILATGQRLHQAGDFVGAEQAYRRLLAAEPANAELWYVTASVCQAQGKSAEALNGFLRSVELKPDFAQGHNSLGILLAQAGRAAEAETWFRRAVAAKPDFAHAHNNLGNSLKEQGKLAEAESSYRQAVRLKPDFAEAQNNLGNLLRERGSHADAVVAGRLAVSLKPELADAHNNLGAALAALEQWEEAAACYRQAIVLRPQYAEAHNNLGNALRELKRYSEALVSLREAVRLRPDWAEAHDRLGVCLMDTGDLDAAAASCREAIRRKPDLADAHVNLGFILSELGQLEAALDCYEHALQRKPDLVEARKNRSLIWLLQGKFEEGWREYELRWQSKELPRRPFRRPEWDGSPLEGRTILIHAEQGLGDTFQFLRYLPLVHERGGKLIFVCQKALLPLLTGCAGVDQLVPQRDHLPPFDVHAPLLRLPRIFGTRLATIPADVPYLQADPQLVDDWRRELAGVRGLRVGIAWQGSKVYRWDRYRSIALGCFEPLARVPGVRLISLQKGRGSEQIAAVAERFEVLDLGSRLDEAHGPFMDTAAVMKNLDLVITSDTSVPHLAGALGVPTWLAVPFAPDWRWLLEREDCPWYPTMRLFRQRRRGDWDDVFARMAEALRAQVAGPPPRRPVLVEIAPGELFDKLTILEIKNQRISDPAKLDNVRRELAELKAARAGSVREVEGLVALIAELKRVNEALWDIEDEIRVCERQRDFGPRFVELARSVYHQNDQRAAVKRRINELLGSKLIEEKSYQAY